MQRATCIVVTNQDGARTLRACVEALIARLGDSDPRIVVADCGSTDDSLAIARSIPGIELVEFDSRNVAAVLNQLFETGTGDDNVLRVRSDVIVRTDGFLGRLTQCAEDHPQAGVIGARLVHPDGRIRSIGRNIITGVGVYPRHANRQQFQPDPGSERLVEVDAAPGAFAFYRREVIDQIGGLDEGYGLGFGDDDDFCLGARNLGHTVLVDTGIEVVDLSPAFSPTTVIPDPELYERVQPAEKTEAVLQRAQAPYFAAKWGWDPRFPDLDEIRRLFGHTALCWRIGEAMRWRPSGEHPAVDVVIVTWNNRAMLERCLRSVAETRYPEVRVHVTDNGSSDGTPAMVERMRATFPFPLTLHRLAVNTGVAVGFNWGIVHGDAELVARLDDDVVVPPDWLEKMVETMHRRPFAGCVGPKILNDDARHTIQCGPFRMFPGTWGHTDEEDRGQADYVARTVHVRGCCNLYRRDVLDACGLFDLRFSPSQWDDPDHHAALGVAGYEVVYDGRVDVVHALTTGKGRSWPAVTNQRANGDKLVGKWGREIWRILDTSLDLSRLGRLLPAGDDDPRLQPEPGTFPRAVTMAQPADDPEAEKFLRYQRMALDPDGPLDALWRGSLARARFLRRDGNARRAAELLHALLDLVPAWADAALELAGCYADLAQPDEVARWLQLVHELSRDPAQLAAADALAAGAGRPRVDGDPGDRTWCVGPDRAPAAPTDGPRRRRLRVLMTNTYMGRCAGGDMLQLKKTREFLERAGAEVEVAWRPHPDPRGFDVVHAFNLWFPAQVLPQVRGMRMAAPDVPIVLSPIYWSMAEKNWAERAIPLVFRDAETPEHLERMLAALADGTLAVDGCTRDQAEEDPFPGFRDYQRRILETVDHLLPQSERERDLLQRQFGIPLPSTVVRNAVDCDLFADADAEWFRRRTGLRDFVLTVGLVEVRKNQLLLLQALRDTGLPVLVVGRCYDDAYMRACRAAAGPGTLFLDHLPHEQLASALRAARVFALPSWMECAAFASLEAAAAGCQLVVGDRTSEREYFGDAAYYADPADIGSIRRAVLTAWQNRDADADRRRSLQARCRQEYTWEQVAERTLLGYEEAIAARRRGAAASALVEVP